MKEERGEKKNRSKEEINCPGTSGQDKTAEMMFTQLCLQLFCPCVTHRHRDPVKKMNEAERKRREDSQVPLAACNLKRIIFLRDECCASERHLSTG